MKIEIYYFAKFVSNFPCSCCCLFVVIFFVSFANDFSNVPPKRNRSKGNRLYSRIIPLSYFLFPFLSPLLSPPSSSSFFSFSSFSFPSFFPTNRQSTNSLASVNNSLPLIFVFLLFFLLIILDFYLENIP